MNSVNPMPERRESGLIKIELEQEPPDNRDLEQANKMMDLAIKAAWRIFNRGDGEREAINYIVDRATNDPELRREYYTRIRELFHKEGIAALAQTYQNRVRQQDAKTPKAQARAKWAVEAKDAGFDDVEDYLSHLQE